MAALDIGGKGLEELPSDLRDGHYLESLHCQDNLLTTIPKSFFSTCQSLKWLDLRNNRLTTLPSTIYRLRELRTLLLAGNLLETLPVQLCLLPHLTGLSISRNPLKDPPQHIVSQGTKMVLLYLQDKMRRKDGLDNGEEIEARLHDCMDYNSSSEDSTDECGTHPSRFNKKTHQHVSTEQQLVHPLNFPGPTMHQAVLHSMRLDQQSKPKYRPRLDTPAASNGRRNSRRKEEHYMESKSSRTKLPSLPVVVPTVDELQENNKETADISKALEKMKAQRGLEDWRKKAKMMQMNKYRELSVSRHDKASVPRSLSQVFPANPASGSATPPTVGGVHSQVGGFPGGGSNDQMLKDEERQRRRQLYKHGLEERRKQAGIISIPTSDLQQAEDRLAEAMAMQDEMEHRNREYRLRAFTGDIL